MENSRNSPPREKDPASVVSRIVCVPKQTSAHDSNRDGVGGTVFSRCFSMTFFGGGGGGMLFTWHPTPDSNLCDETE